MQRTALAGKRTSIDALGRSGSEVFVTTKDKVSEMKNFLVDFLKDEEGLTMVEYAVAGSLVAAAAVTAFTNLGAAIVLKIQGLVTAVNS